VPLVAVLAIVFATFTSPFHETSELVDELADLGRVADVHMPFCPPHDDGRPQQKHAEFCHLLMRLATQTATELAPFSVPLAPYTHATEVRFSAFVLPRRPDDRASPFQPRAPPLAAA